MKSLIVVFPLVLVSASAACLPVTGSRIFGRDLALADPRFSALPATLAVGFTPAPGTRRIYATLELQRLARANGLTIPDAGDICFELPMLRPVAEDALAAMRRSLPVEAELRIIEMANFDVPAGPVDFPFEGLEPPVPSSHGVQLWRGRVKYAETRQMAFWARVEITVKFTAVIAVKDIPSGSPVGVDSLRIESRTGPLERETPATRLEEVVGRISKRALKAGSIVPLGVLSDAPTVRKGDPVSVEVQSGPAHLRFQAIAESSACDGEIVELRNPFTGRTFRAKLDPGAKAVVIVSAGQKL